MLTGMPGEKVVHAHGSFNAASCITCGERRSLDEVKDEILKDDVPICSKCGGESGSFQYYQRSMKSRSEFAVITDLVE